MKIELICLVFWNGRITLLQSLLNNNNDDDNNDNDDNNNNNNVRALIPLNDGVDYVNQDFISNGHQKISSSSIASYHYYMSWVHDLMQNQFIHIILTPSIQFIFSLLGLFLKSSPSQLSNLIMASDA